MAIKIKGLNKPKNCYECRFSFISGFSDKLEESWFVCFFNDNEPICSYKNRDSMKNFILGDCPITQEEEE